MGFYFVFMVVLCVDVFSWKVGGEEIWCWLFNGEGVFEIFEVKEDVNLFDGWGIFICMYLLEESKEFFEFVMLNCIIKDYFDYIFFFIFFVEDVDGDGE